MKKICLILILCCGCSSEHVSPTDFAGTWFLNDKDESYGGEMVISNCVDSTCDFTLAAWNGYYTCMADGKITVNKNRAEYKTTTVAYNDATNQMEQTDVGIMFHMARVGNLDVRYYNDESAHEFCGMNASLEGKWVKQQ